VIERSKHEAFILRHWQLNPAQSTSFVLQLKQNLAHDKNKLQAPWKKFLHVVSAARMNFCPSQTPRGSTASEPVAARQASAKSLWIAEFFSFV
jgi:hypothetical protein